MAEIEKKYPLVPSRFERKERKKRVDSYRETKRREREREQPEVIGVDHLVLRM